MRPADGERGYALLDALAGAALTIAVVVTAAGAVASALHDAAAARARVALTDDARNVLADLRALVAYGDPGGGPHLLAALAGRSASITLRRSDGLSETIELDLAPQPPGATQTIATASASAGGVTVTERRTIAYEAPAPGSTVRE